MPKIDFVFASLLEDSDSQSSLIPQTDDSSSKVEFNEKCLIPTELIGVFEEELRANLQTVLGKTLDSFDFFKEENNKEENRDSIFAEHSYSKMS